MTARRKVQAERPAVPGAPVPAHLMPFVEILGAGPAVDFLLRFGGGVVHLSENPQAGRSLATSAIGDEKKVRALAKAVGSGTVRIPVGKAYIARYFRDMGYSVTAIARKLHVTDVTVRTMLRPADDRQMTLFDLPPPIR